jgi:hypothetical protein
MFERVLTTMRERVRTRHYVMTVHAEEEMDADGLSIFDVENAILSGRIVEQQVDRAWGDRKYVIRGRPLEGDDAVLVVARLGPTGKLVILTVYTV